MRLRVGWHCPYSTGKNRVLVPSHGSLRPPPEERALQLRAPVVGGLKQGARVATALNVSRRPRPQCKR